MLGPEEPLVHRQGTGQQLAGLGVALQVAQHRGKAVHRLRDVGMIPRMQGLLHRQRLPVEHLGIRRATEFLPQLRAWLDAGTLAMHFDETDGIDSVLTAYARMLTGGTMGKAIVRIAG